MLTISFNFLKIREFVKDVQEELSKPGFNSFGLGDCKVPKVLETLLSLLLVQYSWIVGMTPR